MLWTIYIRSNVRVDPSSVDFIVKSKEFSVPSTPPINISRKIALYDASVWTQHYIVSLLIVYFSLQIKHQSVFLKNFFFFNIEKSALLKPSNKLFLSDEIFLTAMAHLQRKKLSLAYSAVETGSQRTSYFKDVFGKFGAGLSQPCSLSDHSIK